MPFTVFKIKCYIALSNANNKTIAFFKETIKEYLAYCYFHSIVVPKKLKSSVHVFFSADMFDTI